MVSCHIVALPLVLRVYVNGDREVTEQTNFNLPRKVPADIVFLYHSHSHGRGLEPWNQLRMKFPSHSYSNSYSEVLFIDYGNEEEVIEEGRVENRRDVLKMIMLTMCMSMVSFFYLADRLILIIYLK